MKLLALEVERPGADADAFAPHLKAEAARLWELQAQGLVREAHFRADRHTAVLVLECASEAAAHEALASLPLVREGLITFDVVPLAPYTGYARLFGDAPEEIS